MDAAAALQLFKLAVEGKYNQNRNNLEYSMDRRNTKWLDGGGDESVKATENCIYDILTTETFPLGKY